MYVNIFFSSFNAKIITHEQKNYKITKVEGRIKLVVY